MLQINHMIGKILMNLDNLKNVIEQSQRTQRNWDLNKQIPKEDLDTIIYAIANAPSKQNLQYFNKSCCFKLFKEAR